MSEERMNYLPHLLLKFEFPRKKLQHHAIKKVRLLSNELNDALSDVLEPHPRSLQALLFQARAVP